jgi:hypothetical protein
MGMPFWQTNNYIGFEKSTTYRKNCKVLILMKLIVLRGKGSLPESGLNLLSFKKLWLSDDYIIWSLFIEN